MSQPHYPYRSSDMAVLGPEVFASADGMTISWKGANYRRDHGEPTTAEAAIARVRALHQPAGVVAATEFGNPPDCTTCGPNTWPCPTYNAVTEPAPPPRNCLFARSGATPCPASIPCASCDRPAAPAPAATEATEPGHVTTVEGNPAAAAEAIRQMDADPHGLKAGMIVQPYRDHGEQKWVFRCWGTDDGCGGLLSLDHYSEQSAERARDRHVAEEHAEPAEPATITDPEWLRQQYAAAIDGGFRTFDADKTEDAYLIEHLATAVLAVRDRHLQQLRQRLELADQAHREHTATLDRIRALEARLWQADDSRVMPASAVCHAIANDLRVALDQPQEQP